MIIEDSERLDAALAGRSDDGSGEMRALVALAAELRDGLGGRWLTADERSRLYAQVVSLAEAASRGTVWRRFRLDRRTPALLGGAVVTLAAAAAIGVAVARGRRQQQRIAAAA